MKKLLVYLVLSSLLAASEMVSRTQVIMGTFATITLEKEEVKNIETGFKLLKSVENELSSYDVNADIYRLNLEGHTDIGAYTYEALLKSKRYYKETNGYFDISVGSITKDIYHFGEDEHPAQPDELEDAYIAFSGLHFEKDSARLDENITVDLGGMGKGFGVDKVSEYYKRQEIVHGKIVLSGDIRCLSKCEIGIQDPFSEHIRFTFKTLYANTAISTSGNYRRFVKDKAHNHLIDPKQKRSQQRVASITLISHGSNSDLDAYATASSVMPVDEAKAFLRQLPLAYIIIETDGTTTISDNINAYMLFLDDAFEGSKKNKPQ